ncbi:histidine kinase [Luteolibacter marinus]|uniref:histidine kinase n=1 Tax=Luteolibacter marinus TaxID=2776705 RepID=UPI001868BFE7|nr:histidine kinase [Luteolibacter marinus]
MTRSGRILLLLPLILPAHLGAEEASWEYRLARKVDGRLDGVERELVDIRGQLPSLPEVPVADQGGTGGFASMHPGARAEAGSSYSVELRCPEAHEIDLVALVPARRYGVSGLESQFGLPDDFTVDLIDGAGEVVARIADERNLWADPVRTGHPFVYPVSPAVTAAGLRITAGQLRLDPDVLDSYVHAWAEAFLFSGDTNVARQAAVTSSGGVAPSAPWQWNNAFLVDGLTPLGLPELPGEVHRNVGWISEGRPKANDPVWIEMDLGKPCEFDAIRLFPAKRPTSDLPSGFGFPRRFKVTASATRSGGRPVETLCEKDVEITNPGHNPVLIPLERCKAQYLKIQVTELWKAFENYPAFFALSEVEVLDGEMNQAKGATFQSPFSLGNVVGPGFQSWNTASLSDGFGPDGRLVSRRAWLVDLDRRLALEQRQFDLRQESQAIIAGWRRAGLAAFATCGGLGAILLVALPLRYRSKAKKQLTQVRERIAGDLHDEVGSNLGSIQMIADLAEGRSGPSEELKRIQRIAAETVSAVRDIVWLLRPQGDHRIGTVEHLRETSSIMLERLEWDFTANEAAWQVELSDEENRHLFLFFREALHNILRHAKATRVDIRAEQDDGRFRLTVADDGVGIDPQKLERPATQRALRERVKALGAEFKVDTCPDEGTRLDLSIPLGRKRRPGS